MDHIFYGTDYPFDWPVGIDFVLQAPFLSDSRATEPASLRQGYGGPP